MIVVTEHMRRAVFIDRDGVICRNRSDYVKSWQEFVFLRGALRTLARLAQSDLAIVVVTNQSAINRHIVSEDTVADIHARMVRTVEMSSGRIDQVIYCPHRPDEHCLCRKPQPGLVLESARQLDIDVSGSYLIGDAFTDIMAGRVAGCARCYLVLTGRGLWQWVRHRSRFDGGYRIALNLGTAVDDILRHENAIAG